MLVAHAVVVIVVILKTDRHISLVDGGDLLMITERTSATLFRSLFEKQLLMRLSDFSSHSKLSLLYYWLLELLFQFCLFSILQQYLTSCEVCESTHLLIALLLLTVLELLHFLPIHL